jgi:hypothetical protein
MSNYLVLQRVRLSARHQPTGKTRHYHGAMPIPAPAELLIVRYPDDSGFYLLHFDEKGNELTDTYHDTLEDAQTQADWEFHVKSDEWEIVNSK